MKFTCDQLASDKLKPAPGSKYHIKCPKSCYSEFKTKT